MQHENKRGNMRNDILEHQRAQRNKELIEASQRGESTSAFSTDQSWFPQRPIIKKNKREMARLYGVVGSGDDEDEVEIKPTRLRPI